MKRAKYICLEGTEGVGKTTQTQKLVDYLRSKGYSVLQTKEPGTSHSPLTMVLRGIMLDKQYDEQLTAPARELVSQAIRSIHLEKVIVPALSQYDFIVQDRGILSGWAYGSACGNDINWLKDLTTKIIPNELRTNNVKMLYDDVIYLKGNIREGLNKALTSKQEFSTGDAMEARGVSFITQVSENMNHMSRGFNTIAIAVDGKDIETVFAEILCRLDLKE